MKMIITSALALCSLGLFAESLVAHWDFSKSVNPLKSSIKMGVRGKTAIVKEGKETFLRINGNGKDAAGVVVKGLHKVLSPAAFRAEVTFRLKNGKAASVNQFLLDSKYLPYPHKSAVHNKGFILYLVQASTRDNTKFYPAVALGFGKSSIFLRGKIFTLLPGKKCVLSFSWNGKNTAEFKVDGKVNSLQNNVKNGMGIVPASYPLVIGDRYGSSYSPVNGDIFEVKLFDLASPKK